MADREKLISALHCRAQDLSIDLPPCDGCDYQTANGRGCDIRRICKDALSLQHEEIAPAKEHSGGGKTWWYVCGCCKTAIDPNDKYCHECGEPVKWE